MALTPGTRLGAYEIVSQLGAGAMGEVYRAKDTRLGRDVALKILPAEFSTNADRRRRFDQESRSASALSHPNIVSVYDAGEEQGVAYMVSELVDGESLRAVIGRGPLPLRRALDLAAQLADGLGAAHSAGVVHRDLKPENIMLTRDGRPKILDFGLARYQAPMAATAEGTATMTQAGVIMGTAGYMSPEQVSGTPADARSDIFSLGIVIYEMLSGKAAFESATTVETMTAILRQEPPELPSAVPENVRQIVMHCMEKEPSRRFQSAQDLAFHLRAASPGSGSTSSHAPIKVAPKRRWLPVVTVVLGLVSIGLSAALLLRKPGVDLGPYRFTPFATESEVQSNPAWSPDGRNVAYERVLINAPNLILVRSLDSPVPNVIAKVKGTKGLFWSADGNLVYFVESDGVWSVSRAGGAQQHVLKGPFEAASASPDGKALVVWYGSDGSDQQKPKLLVSSPPGAPLRPYEPIQFKMNGTFSPVYLRFSPDGRQILLSLYRSRTGGELWLLPFPDGTAARGKPRRILASAMQGAGLPVASWMPDSRHIVMAYATSGRSRLWMADTEKDSLEPITADEGGKGNPAVSPNGKQILFTSGRADYDLVSLAVSGGNAVQPLLATNRGETFPAWSPEGNQFAYVTDRSGLPEIWMKGAEEGWERPLVTGKDFPEDQTQAFTTLAFSPDGSRIAYARSSVKRFSAIWISPVGGGAPIRLTDREGFEIGPAWSPDGNWITYFSSEGGLMKIQVGAGEAPVLLDETSCNNPAQWSPDGQWIACSKDEGVAVLTADGKKVRTVGRPKGFATWSKDGKEIYTLGHDPDGHWRLAATDAKSGVERSIADYGNKIRFGTNFNPGFPLSLSPDGKTLATTVLNERSEVWMLEGFRQP